ncbi:MAG: ferredoxin [Spirochaetaceae bacterium 4572_59]|nr:MAG: ferredoxin [Spirochaetaceae bacterium 4572_59]
MKEGSIDFRLNGKDIKYDGSPLKRLLDVLREDFELTGPKEGCGEGECGACSVFMDGKLVNSCMVPMGSVVGREITTIEAFSETEKGKCLVDAFADAGAVQCGFCTPGMVMASEKVLEQNANPEMDEIRRGLSGNLCRCTGYDMIVDAVKLAAKRGKGLW